MLDQKPASDTSVQFLSIINIYYLCVRFNDKGIIMAIKYSIETTWVAKGERLPLM